MVPVHGPTIDLNADLGETPGDLVLMDVVTSANVACGGHAGDTSTMAQAVEAAVRRGVVVGAHPSYPDRERFGRVELGLPAHEVATAVVEQVQRLAEVASTFGRTARVSYLKLHGALYHRAGRDAELADRLLASLEEVGLGPVPVLAQPGSVLLATGARRGWEPVEEGFCDRAYRGDGTLADRSQPNAVLSSPKEAAAQAVALACRGALVTTEGTVLALRPASLCLHGDSPHALEMAVAVRDALRASGVAIAPFAER